jgi:transcriptional regulator
MYQPKHFRNDDHARLHDLIRGNALGILVTVVDGLPQVDHVPVVLDANGGTCGRLRFHLTRANPLADVLQSPPEGSGEVMFVFRGEQAYVSPDWYGQENMVPTWNYAVAHAHGHVDVLDGRNSPVRGLFCQATNNPVRHWQRHDLAGFVCRCLFRDRCLLLFTGSEADVFR